MTFKVSRNSKTPIYKQLVLDIKHQILNESIKKGTLLPSMNQLCDSLEISKETVKKAYNILRVEGFIDAAHGKGFFVTNSKKQSTKVLIMFDVLSTYKKDLFDSLSTHMGPDTEYTIRLFNQDIDLFEKFLNENLGLFDYYVITPHVPLDPKNQSRMVKALNKIPNRQLVLLDRHLQQLTGNYIAVYQDFEQDVYAGLQQAQHAIKSYAELNICTMSGSLYGRLIQKGIKRFCDDYNVKHTFYDNKIPDKIEAGAAYMILSGQLEHELIRISQIAQQQQLKIGKDIGLLSYNESAINEIILNGLSVLSTDFKEMGRLAATFIKEKKHRKVKCSFNFVKRSTL